MSTPCQLAQQRRCRAREGCEGVAGAAESLGGIFILPFLTRASVGVTTQNKMAPPFREVEIEMEFGRGICKEAELLDMAVKLGRVTKSGAWYAYDGERIGQGKEKVKAYLRENPAVIAALLDAVGGSAATEAGGAMATATATDSSQPSVYEHGEDDGFDPAFAEEDDADEQAVVSSGAGP
jgi:hypothetical protein